MNEQTCPHEDVCWELDAAQEKGWHCLNCREQLGFRPDLDRTHTTVKVNDILHSLHDAGVIYVSNSTEGDLLVGYVAKQCRRADVYDQQSIAFFLLEDQDHKRFWHQAARRWLDEHKPIT